MASSNCTRRADYYHTCYVLSGLSVSQYDWSAPLLDGKLGDFSYDRTRRFTLTGPADILVRLVSSLGRVRPV